MPEVGIFDLVKMGLAVASFVLPVVLGALWLYLEKRLEKTFVRRDPDHPFVKRHELELTLAPFAETLEDLKGSADMLEKSAVGLRELGDSNRDRINRLEQDGRHQAERFAEQIVKPLERITERLEEISKTQARHGEIIAGHGARQDGLAEMMKDIRIRLDRLSIRP